MEIIILLYSFILNLKNFYLIDIQNIFKIWGLGIGDWGLGIGDWGLGPIPNPQSPIPNPPSPNPQIYIKIYFENIIIKIK